MRWLVAVLTMFNVVVVVAPAVGGGKKHDPVTTRAMAFFETAAVGHVDSFLRDRRPASLSPALRAQVLASLPRDGELTPSDAERAKFAALDPVFEFHDRKGLVQVKVIDVGHAFVGLHARTVLLLSRDALSLVTPDELQALAAHELGHEFFWDEYQKALASHEEASMRELELLCDGIAVMTLRALGRAPDGLVSAVTKMTRYNERLGATASGGSYVSLEARRDFIEGVATLLDRSEARSVAR
jgi:hypothetical protein